MRCHSSLAVGGGLGGRGGGVEEQRRGGSRGAGERCIPQREHAPLRRISPREQRRVPRQRQPRKQRPNRQGTRRPEARQDLAERGKAGV